MYAHSIRSITAYLLGLSDAGIDLNEGVELPLLLKAQITQVMQAAVIADENRPSADDPFEKFGVWHRACNRVIADLENDCRAMTCNHEYPHGLGLGDGAFKSFMTAVKAFGIELPDADTLAAADAEREAMAKAEHERGMRAREEMAARWAKNEADGWDDADAYEYV